MNRRPVGWPPHRTPVHVPSDAPTVGKHPAACPRTLVRRLHGMQHPPIARREPTTREHHGDRFDDHYAWMADRDSDELRELLVAENAHATEREQYAVEARVLVAAHPERPALDGGRPPAGEQVILDHNEEGRDHEFFA